jgi:hypothetical protein
MATGSALVAVLALGFAGFLLWPQHQAVASAPYSVDVGCTTLNAKTGRVPITLTATSHAATPLRFQGHIRIAIRRIRAGGDPAHDWVRYRYVDAGTPLVTIPPGDAISWSTVKGPVLLHGSTAHLRIGGCTFYADPPGGR